MVKIHFNNDYSWENLPEARVRRVLALDIVTERVALMRNEWQEAAGSEGKSIDEMQVNIELLLSDLCDLLELLPAERARVFDLALTEVVP